MTTTTKVAPKLIQEIDDDNVILWFEKPNKYIITTKENSKLIQLYTNPDESRDSFVTYISNHLFLEPEKAIKIYEDIAEFIGTIHSQLPDRQDQIASLDPTEDIEWIESYYAIYNKTIHLRFGSEVIKRLIHPQIAHHQVPPTDDCDISYDFFRSGDDLFLKKGSDIIGTYTTSAFHFLQGKFALELTNCIHNSNLEHWIATFHASTVTNGKESIMLIGDSGNGKSTLSVILMANGFEILCDDFTPLYQDTMELYRYPAATSVKRGAFDILKPFISDLDELKTYTNGPKKVGIKYIPPLHLYKDLKPSFPCRKIVYVKFDSEAKNTLKPVPKSKVLETLIPDSWISPKESHASMFLNWLTTVHCYQLIYNDNNFAISKFKALFNNSF